MKKDFKTWHQKKSAIDEIAHRPFFHEREVWFCHLGANIGFEQDGQGTDFLRPVVILRKFNKEIFWGIPLTKSKSDKKRTVSARPFYFSFSFIVDVQSDAVLSQIRLIDARRLGRKIGEMSKDDFASLKKQLITLLL
ncbi:hypothetical protein A3A36_00845 [Candidatus Kaiserbacteria bacterium RIFCSPLOWO2_01_FULL_52_12b]|uniref:mRNA interferase n=1 Tax=Candidatus Kaiserbacteria bacterium RIFCSPLOWO2_01_FULL_52_12b TaxID=1798509 RepID=A0A1F6EXI8_9BACT|nr:MAG: hypothetical protein A3A36_00845 [Candidatus Kaiserbacteria bacterium RIFCSPLOWO2_01_FULL_52_12b]